MTMRERLKGSTRHDSRYSRAVFTGNFAILQEFLLEKESFLWSSLRLCDFLLRGFSQVAVANNPISGLLIVTSLAFTAPGTLVFSAITGFLGLLLSVLIQDSQKNIANGVTVLNPLLIGAVSYAFVPKFYGPFDAFSILLILLTTIFSVYLARSLGNSKSPCLAWPFNLAEFVLLLILHTQDNGPDTANLQLVMRTDNATSDATTGDVSFIVENATGVHIDWGMVFHGVILSGSQVFAVESVVTGSIVYLATLLFSPTTAGFAFLGALTGSLAGIILFLCMDLESIERLMLDAKLDEIYRGVWGYNTFLTGALLGGTLLVLNGQTAIATIVAIIYTAFVQYSILFFLRDLKLPVMTLPFVLVTSLFLKLRNNSDKTFPEPMSHSFPEKQRLDYLANQRMLIQQMDDPEIPGDDFKDQKVTSPLNI